jgi:hypothetical protein
MRTPSLSRLTALAAAFAMVLATAGVSRADDIANKLDTTVDATTEQLGFYAPVDMGGVATSLRHDTTTGQFIQNWKTPTGTNVCYSVRVAAADGSALTALFKLK